MRFSALVDRVRGEGASAWRTYYEAVAALERGEDVIILVCITIPMEGFTEGPALAAPSRGSD